MISIKITCCSHIVLYSAPSSIAQVTLSTWLRNYFLCELSICRCHHAYLPKGIMAYLPLFMALPPFWRILPHAFVPMIWHYACMPLCPQYDIQWILYYIIIQWILYYPYAAIPRRLYFPKTAIFWLISTFCHLDTHPLFLLFAAVSLLVLPECTP